MRNRAIIGCLTTFNDMEWDVTFGGIHSEEGDTLVQTTDGGYALGGRADSDGAWNFDMWLVKTDGYGQEEWNVTYGGIEGEVLVSMVQTADGGYALLGETFSYGAGRNDFWLVKTNSTGQAEWNYTYGDIGGEKAEALIQTSDNGFALLGLSNSSSAGDYDFWLVKTDSNGQEEWNNTFGGTGDEMGGNPAGNGRSLVQTTDGGYAFTGGTNSYSAGGQEFWLVKTNATGQAEWNKTFGSDFGGGVAHALVQTTDGGYALTGSDFWLVKTDATGQEEWNTTSPGAAWKAAWALVQTTDGGFALGGYIFDDDLDAWLVKTDNDGQEEWNKTFGGQGDDYALCMVQTTDGSFALGGSKKPDDFWLIKTPNSPSTTTTETTTTTTIPTSTSTPTTTISGQYCGSFCGNGGLIIHKKTIAYQ
ncbi:MAG: hypothetical protein ACW98I_15855 [Candidatus Hodarchaeales archaeon]